MDEQKLEVVEKLEKVMANLIDLFGERGQLAVLNDAAIARLESELEILKDVSNGQGGVQERNKRHALINQLHLLRQLRDYSHEHGLSFDFAVLSTKNFSSGLRETSEGKRWSSTMRLARNGVPFPRSRVGSAPIATREERSSFFEGDKRMSVLTSGISPTFLSVCLVMREVALVVSRECRTRIKQKASRGIQCLRACRKDVS